MKKELLAVIFILPVLMIAGCHGNQTVKKNKEAQEIAAAVPDTGFTGIKQYKRGNYLIKEVTFKNGIKEGLTKTFYMSGQVYQTFWYKNNLREDSACWYYLEGQLFRTTPFKHDTIDGIQKQYYRNGDLRANIGYSKGMRNSLFEEYTTEGKRVGPYPQMMVMIRDKYMIDGTYSVDLAMTDKNIAVKFYRGRFENNRLDTTKLKPVPLLHGVPTITLKKSTKPGTDHLDIIASFFTTFGNKYFEYKKVEVPYDDLN